MAKPAKFLEMLNKFIEKVEKSEVPEKNFKSIQKIIVNPNFNPTKMVKISAACAALCEWVLNMVKYHDNFNL